MTTRLVVVDDQELVRSGFRLILERAGFEVVGEAGDGLEAIDVVRAAGQPPGRLQAVHHRHPDVHEDHVGRQVAGARHGGRAVRGVADLDEYVHAALRAGASGFLLKDAHPEELLAGIRAVAVGDAVIAPALTRRLLDEFAHHLGGGAPATDPRLGTLTDREREILIAIGRGWTNGEIAERLVLSESTVKTHVGRVLAKIGARDRIQAVILAYDLGLTRPQQPG
jgi:DNA-binding NarL/FixJ family response regulator